MNGTTSEEAPPPQVPDPCDHDWKLVSDSAGEGPYYHEWAYWECQKCDATKEVGPHDLQDDENV